MHVCNRIKIIKYEYTLENKISLDIRKYKLPYFHYIKRKK